MKKLTTFLLTSVVVLATHQVQADPFSELDDEFEGCKKVKLENQQLKNLVEQQSQKLNQQNQRLQQQNATLTQQNDSISQQNSTLAQCSELSAVHQQMTQKVQDLSAKLNVMTVENNSLKQQVATLQANSTSSSVNTELVNTLKGQVAALQAQIAGFNSVPATTAVVASPAVASSFQPQTLGSIKFEIDKCSRTVSTVECSGFSTALETDSTVIFHYDTKVTMGNGDTFSAQQVKLANKKHRYNAEVELIQGVRTKFKARFNEIKGNRANVAAVSFRFHVDGSWNWVTFRNIPLQ